MACGLSPMAGENSWASRLHLLISLNPGGEGQCHRPKVSPLFHTRSSAWGIWWLSLEVPSWGIYLGRVSQFKAAIDAHVTRKCLRHSLGTEMLVLPQY